MAFGTLFSLGLYFIVMIGIGLYAFKKSTSDAAGYMLGGRNLSPSVTALSAGASDMSGWMLMGIPGAMYVTGLSSIWIAVGLVIGAYFNYLIVAPRLRTYTEVANDSITLPDFFENRFNDKRHLLRVVSSIVIIVFFTLYTSSGIVAGGKLFESSFGLDYEVGLYVTAGVVVLYTMFGGFLAVSLTDFVQGCIMFVALVLVPFVVISDIGGVQAMNDVIHSIDAEKFNMFNGVSALAIISAMAWGLGYFGQPHIIVRFMAIRSVKDLPAARRIGMTWMIVSICGAMATGFAGIAYVAKTGTELTDPETIFVLFSQVLFHPLISGFLLAAILAAIMSTISSQLLVTSSSLTGDFYQAFLNKDATDKQLVFVGRLSVLLVAIVAISLAYDRNSSILSLVSNAWAGFGAAFGPLVILSLYWKKMNKQGALAGMLTGAITVLIWIYAPITVGGELLSSVMYEIVPGFILSTIAIVVVSNFTAAPDESVEKMFDEMLEQHNID
ncbi:MULTISPECIES: sodium/proline symporter PutP [unclassified Colwellia]|uniref:sodium/proline symporter PutP n=1 Tax=unclassified Colwellia TaxID=196834 RepID=UPI0015F40653|nr:MULTISPECIES: sodium/proline symporter PutP [unclassified Colwellia]MBA6379558.1 sodium/proline symporter PutP [Colwellia sp. BRX10-7]MBA6384727.1 sodium/proline symporter PutP [Colwellia sp. BRX10-9]MBA6386155.1 sodium/proline symporter PutP [Colwellia sp. BRX10-2]MBA6395219.1 sodium/proline symporter PutP [Colwellia sp. BRX10-6]MBA6403260.1 sodium/proline symporter PutP [Colwellia sp. BRX10-5]